MRTMGILVFRQIAKLWDPYCCHLHCSRRMATCSEQSTASQAKTRSIYEDSIVISGISARLPKSLTMEEFKWNLLNAVDMTTDEKRWNDDKLPERNGYLNCLDKFDASFFNQTPRQAEQMDPQTRLLLEASYEAIFDAGFSPTEFRSSRTGVFSAALGGEALDYGSFHFDSELSGYLGLSAYNYMIPAKIAFVLDLQGASSLVSSACSSSFSAIEAAVYGIAMGKLDAAIVTGSNVCLNPRFHLEYIAAGALSKDGHSKAFDESADGFARAEAAVAILIQRETDARRSYCKIVNVGSRTDGFKHEGITHPSGKIQEKLIRELYEEVGIDPTTEVSYVDAHGTGTPTGDPVELRSIHSVFCKSPSGMRGSGKPLLLGSVKSNMGHAESAAGLASVAKVITSIQTGVIPPNLHFRKPKPELEPLLSEGNLKIVTESTPFDGGFIGINSFGIGGTNSHLILEPGKLSSGGPNGGKNLLPILFPFAGRTEEKVRESLHEAAVHAECHPEYRFLLQKAFGTGIPGYSYRGYGLCIPGEGSPIFKVENCKHPNPSLWIVFPGMGSQWSGMGKDLMRIEPFAESVHRSRVTLANIGINVNELLQENNASIFENIHHAMMTIATIQLALWDTLKELNLNPDGFIGHSNGEFLCAYADGCFNAEETLLMSDARGRAFIDGQMKVGGMASVGMSPQDITQILPPSIEIACYNSQVNVTICGELDHVRKFVEELKSRGKFAVMVNSCGIAAHGRLMEKSAELFMDYASGILSEDRARSDRWISTCIPESGKSSLPPDVNDLASPAYFRQNIQAPVLFSQACKEIPSQAVVIEVSPKGFFQAILKECTPKDCIHVAPMNYKAEDKLWHFYESVGHLHNSGLDVHIENLYPSVPLPVPADTPWISPLVKWDHSRSWKTSILRYPLEAGMEKTLDLKSPTHAALGGHKVEDRVLYPATGYLVLAWSHYEEINGHRPQSTPVVLKNVVLKRATILNKESPSVIFATLLNGSGAFEFKNEAEVVVCGTINLLEKTGSSKDSSVTTNSNPQTVSNKECWLPLNTDDIYKELRLRGYNYSGAFKGIHKIDNEGKWAEVVWKDNWITFLDTLLQASILTTTTRNLSLPVEIEKITIDPTEFSKHLEASELGRNENGDQIVRVNIEHTNRTLISCPGVEIQGLVTTNVPRKGQKGNLAYEKFEFCPFIDSGPHLEREAALREIVDLVLENNNAKRLDVIDIFTAKENSVAKAVSQIMQLKPLQQCDLHVLTLRGEVEGFEGTCTTVTAKEEPTQLQPEIPGDLVILGDLRLLGSTTEKVKPSGFLLLHSTHEVMPIQGVGDLHNFTLIARKTSPSMAMALYRKMEQASVTVLHAPLQESKDFDWVPSLQELLRTPTVDSTSRIYITSQNPQSGILGLFKCLQKEEELKADGRRLRCIFDPDKKLNLNFTAPDQMLESIIKMDLAVNVVRNGQLGSHRHIPLKMEKDSASTGGLTEETEDAFLTAITPGDLSSLKWVQSPLQLNRYGNMDQCMLNGAQELYDIAYAAMNFRDVLLAAATIPIESKYTYKESYMGFEFSGFDPKGNRVMGIGEGGLLATRGLTDPHFVWPVPEQWTLEEAATVPLVYATVLYGFHMRAGGLKKGQKVLIHSGTGGIGIAAINVALAHGCEVFTTVGSRNKRETLKSLFPTIQDDHISNSRDTSFEAQFMQVTNGKGVDIVLNSLAGDKLEASLRCLGINGKFLEIGVYDAHKNTLLGMRTFLKNIQFHGIGLYHVMREGSKYGQQLKELMQVGVESGAVQPLPRQVFQSSQAEQAFRFMASGNHIGKLLIKIRDENSRTAALRIPALSRSYFSQHKVYIIVGGLGGFGLEVANWLVERGVRNLVLTSRSGVTNGYQSYCIRKWTEIKGVNVQTPVIDLSKKEVAEAFMKEIKSSSLPGLQVGGIFNCAMVLEDREFIEQTKQTFAHVSAPKANVTLHLDELSRELFPDMDYFVVFSSISCGKGTAEQTNYGWANSVMERICEKRSLDGFHGLAIQWGVIGQVGFVAEKIMKNDVDGTEVIAGTLPQNVESCLEVLDAALVNRKYPVASSMVVAPKEKVSKGVKGALISRMENIFGIKDLLESVSPDKKLSELGMDSMIAFELKQTLERDYDLPLTKESLRLLTVQDLMAIDAGTYGFAQDGTSTERIGERHPGESCGFLVKLESANYGPKIFMVHGTLGGADMFRPLAAKLHADAYAFELVQETNVTAIREIAQLYIKKIKAVQAEGPYRLVGYSAGGCIAYEMAVQLQDHGDEVAELIFLDGQPTYLMESLEDAKKAVISFVFSASLFRHLSSGQLKEIERNLTGDIAKDSEMIVQIASPAVPLHVAFIQHRLTLLHALMEYAVSTSNEFSGKTVAIHTKWSDLSGMPPGQLEQRCVGPLLQYRVDGDHESFLTETHVEQSAKILRSVLCAEENSDKK